MVKPNKEEIKKNVLNKEVFISSIFLIIASFINPLIGKFVIPLYDNSRLSPNDLFFIFLPYVRYMANINVFFSILIAVIFVISIFKKNGYELSKYLTALSIAYWIRCFVILLTPLGVPSGIDLTNVNTSSIWWDSGFFFSGHTVFYVTTYLYIDPMHKTLKKIGLLICILGIITILLARNHYTIDIYGGLITSLLIYEYMRKSKYK